MTWPENPHCGKFGSSLHEQDDRIFRDHFLDTFTSIGHGAGPHPERKVEVPPFHRLDIERKGARRQRESSVKVSGDQPPVVFM